MSDTVLGGLGADRINGGSGRDRLDGEAGDDIVEGGSEADILEGDAGRDRVFRGRGFVARPAGGIADGARGDGISDRHVG
jgi:Ca2+-binding RTX toxin-like protein